jgi:hypothetical protein
LSRVAERTGRVLQFKAPRFKIPLPYTKLMHRILLIGWDLVGDSSRILLGKWYCDSGSRYHKTENKITGHGIL